MTDIQITTCRESPFPPPLPCDHCSHRPRCEQIDRERDLRLVALVQATAETGATLRVFYDSYGYAFRVAFDAGPWGPWCGVN